MEQAEQWYRNVRKGRIRLMNRKRDYLSEHREISVLKTKTDILEAVDQQVLLWSAGQGGCTEKYCQEMVRILQQFAAMVRKCRIFDAPDGWNYAIEIRGNGISLMIEAADKCGPDQAETGIGSSMMTYELLQARAALITVEEYAALQGITHVASVSRIRRGKIRCAVKQNGEWRIPALAPPVTRGYRPATYIWMGWLQGLSPQYEVLNQYSQADFYQDDSMLTQFHVKFSGDNSDPLEFVCTREQRGTIEQLLIAHPDVRCLTDIIMRISNTAKENGICVK